MADENKNKEKVNLGKLYKVQEVANYLGLSRERVYHYIREKILVPSIKGKKFTRFTKEDIVNGLANLKWYSNPIKKLNREREGKNNG